MVFSTRQRWGLRVRSTDETGSWSASEKNLITIENNIWQSIFNLWISFHFLEIIYFQQQVVLPAFFCGPLEHYSIELFNFFR